MTTPGEAHPRIYLPQNDRLDDLLRADGYRFHSDHARLLLHFISIKLWTGDVDDNGYAHLMAAILRKWIQPRAYAALKADLMAAGVIECSPYSAGHFSSGFRIAAAFAGPPIRYEITYPPLARKLFDWRRDFRTAATDAETQAAVARREPLLRHLRESLDRLSLPMSPTELSVFLREQADPGHVQYVGLCIEHHDYEPITVDAFGQRVHSLLSRTSSALRPHLLLDGQPVAEVDLANSQPLLLAMLFFQQHSLKTSTSTSTPARPRLGPGPFLPGPVPVPFQYVVHPPRMLCIRGLRREAGEFLAVCEDGKLYDLLASDAGLSRDEAKRQLFRDVLFGKPHVQGPVTRAFGRHWPRLLRAIREYKVRHGYKAVAQALQRLEAAIVIDTICPRLMREMPGVPFLTIHDSALLTAGAAETVRDIMADEFAELGVRPTFRIKRREPETGCAAPAEHAQTPRQRNAT